MNAGSERQNFLLIAGTFAAFVAVLGVIAAPQADDTPAKGGKAAAAGGSGGATDGSGGKPAAPGGSGKPAGSAAAASLCRTVNLGPAVDSDTKDFYETAINAIPGMSAKKIDDGTMIMCGSPSNIDVFQDLVQRLTDFPAGDPLHDSHIVRLFYYRDAASIASAINNIAGLSTPVTALGDDLLVFPAESRADDQAIHELKRWIAMIDVPRPEVSLAAWSVQVSSAKPDAVDQESENIRQMVSVFNQRLHDSVQQGWRYMEGRRLANGSFFNRPYSSYLSNRFYGLKAPAGASGTVRVDAAGGVTGGTGGAVLRQPCDYDQYCLGYTGIFSPIQPSITSMLIALVAANNPGAEIDGFINCMELLGTCPAEVESVRAQTVAVNSNPNAEKNTVRTNFANFSKRFRMGTRDCEYRDQVRILANPNSVGFECFKDQLNESIANSSSRALLKAALADFLFHYKASEIYPQTFIPWNRGASAQALDNLFNPLVVEFNRDLNVYLQWLQFRVTGDQTKNKDVDFAAEGIVTVKVVSGSQATVNTTTQSSFTSPPVLSAAAFATALSGGATGGTGKAAASIITGNLTPIAAQALLAGIQAVRQQTAEVGRSLNLTVTANTLSGASAAELDVGLTSSESAAPSYLDQNGATTTGDLNRVATHNVTTKVRVDSLKLFEISSFSATLTHGRSIPILPPLVDLPFLGSLARLRLPPGTVYHRSFAIVSAVMVPTAADLANAIEFRADVEVGHLPRARFIPQDSAKNSASYLLVTHFKEGVSLTGPIQGPATLQWESPADAQSFDLYRSDKPENLVPGNCASCLLAAGVTGTKFTDPGGAPKTGPAIPAETPALNPIGTPPRNFVEFHRDKVACLTNPSPTACDDVRLSSTPSQR